MIALAVIAAGLFAAATVEVAISWRLWLRSRLPAPAPTVELTPEEREELAKIEVCQHCGGRHAFTCPYILEATYHDSGKLASVRYDPTRAAALTSEILYLE